MHADDAFLAEMEGQRKSDRETERDDAAEWLREHLGAGPVPTNRSLAKSSGSRNVVATA